MSATFTCRPNSHPFQERRVPLTDPSKIGRSVARARPAANNAIFDCKVLSRNHALLWFEDGKFYIKDTKSSNGTFVNNHRLSKGSEESLPYEVNSGDIVQFGVDVVENSRRVTHGCIVSQVRLYLPSGDEAKQSDVTWTSHLIEKVPHNLVYPTIQSQDLYQLHQYLQEALHREQMLEQKLALLQRLVADSHETSEKGWQALIDEDKLLSRLEFLENQIQTYSKTMTEETMQKELRQLQEEKHNYETTSKETLSQVLQEKLEAVRKLCNLERSFSNTEDECTHLREVLSKTQEDLKQLSEKHQQHMRESQRLSEKAQEAERNHVDVRKRLEQDNEEHLANIQKMSQEEEELRNRLEESQEENVTAQNEIEELKKRLDLLEGENRVSTKGNDLTKSEIITGNLKEKLNNFSTTQGDIELNEIKVSLREDKIEVVKTIEICENQPPQDRMNVVEIPLGDHNSDLQGVTQNEVEEHHKEKEETPPNEAFPQRDLITELEARISELQRSAAESTSRQESDERRRKEAEDRLSQIQEEREKEKEMLTETTRALQVALSERENLLEREENLRARIQESEMLLRSCDTDSVSSNSEAEDLDKTAVDPDDDLACGSLTIARAKLKELKKKLKEKEASLTAAQEELKQSQAVVLSQESTEDLKKALNESQDHIDRLEEQVKTLSASSEDSSKLRSELEEACRVAQEQRRMYEAVRQEQQLAIENESAELKELEDRLESEKRENDARVGELDELRASANRHREKYEEVLRDKSQVEANLARLAEEMDQMNRQAETEELTCKNQKLAEEKQTLLDDMHELRKNLEEQQKSTREELQLNTARNNQEWESKLRQKQLEVDEVNDKFAGLLDEQKKLLVKISEQSQSGNVAGWRAIQVAFLALVIGVAYLLWPMTTSSR